MTNSVSFSPEPFEDINRAIGLLRSFSKRDKTHRIAIKQILDLRDALHVRDNLSGIVLQSKGAKIGEVLLALTANTIRALHQISLQFFQIQAPATDVIGQLLDQVHAYAGAERDLGSEPTWLRVFKTSEEKEKERLDQISTVYGTLEK